MGFPRITYNSKNIDFTRYPNRGSGFPQAVKSSVDQAGSGVTEVLHWYTQYQPVLSFRSLLPQEVMQLDDFYDYAKDGSTFTLEFDSGFGAYMGFENNASTNDEVAGTFTRTNVSDSAYYLDPSTGLMTVVNTADTPRYPAGQFGRGIQIDGAATNLITHPSAFDNAAWNKGSATNIDDTDTTETKDPAGANNAEKITIPDGDLLQFDTSTAVGNNCSFGIWLKTITGTKSLRLHIEGTGGGTSTENITIDSTGDNGVIKTDNGWGLYVIENIDTSSFTTNLRFRISNDSGADITFYAWGACGYDSFQFFPGTVGATSTSSITRNEENLEFSSTDILTKEKGTILLWFKPRWNFNEHSAALLFSCADDGTVGTRHSQIEVTSGGNLRFQLRQNNDGTSAVDLQSSLSGLLNQNQFHHFGVTWDATISNGVKLYFDGNLLKTSSNSAFNISELGSLYRLGLVGGSFSPFGTFDDVAIYKEVLTATQISQIYSQGTGLGFRRNRMTCELLEYDKTPSPKFGGVYDVTIRMQENKT